MDGKTILSANKNFYVSSFFAIHKCDNEAEAVSIAQGGGFTLYLITKGRFEKFGHEQLLTGRSGCIWIQKPGTQLLRTVPEKCTVITFTPQFYKWLVGQFRQKSTWLANPYTTPLCPVHVDAAGDYLHQAILQKISGQPQYTDNEIADLVMELLQLVLENLSYLKFCTQLPVHFKAHHQHNMLAAKQYINDHFTEAISTAEIAQNSYTSIFHFSRLFKQFTSTPPHRYLLNIRLKHAELLIKRTKLSIYDICHQSGFSSLDYFSKAFKQNYHYPPSGLRLNNGRLTVV